MARFKCPRCTTILEAEDPKDLVCPHCGYPGTTIPTATPPTLPSVSAPTTRHGKTSAAAVTSTVLGVLGLLPGIGILLGPAAIVLARSSQNQMKAHPEIAGRGLATAGLVLGVASTVFSVLTILLAAFVFYLVSGRWVPR